MTILPEATGFDSSLPQYPSIVHALWAAERDNPNGVALVCGEHRFSYAQFGEAVRALRDQLLARGARQAHVAIARPSSVEAVIDVLATLAAGAQAVPINPFFAEPELAVVLREASPKLALVGPEARSKLAHLAPELGVEYVLESHLGRELTTHHSRPSASASVFDGPVTDPEPDDRALLIFTGGTTGDPKAVVHSHRSISVSLLQHMSAWPLQTRTERLLSAAPIFHIWGLEYATFIPIYCQGTHYIISKYEPEQVLAAIEREAISVFGGGPAPIYMGLTQIERFAQTNFSSLKYCLTGGAPCPEELHRTWQQVTGCALLEGWGMSETGPLCLNPPAAPRRGSVGRPVVGTLVEAVDLETGKQVLPKGEPGELRVRGPQLMLGYQGRPEETQQALRDGWLYTGDIGYVDDDGYVFLVDRKKDMIIVGGYNVYPRSVDEVLFKHPKIAEAATVGRPHERLGEELVAFVAVKPGTTLSEAEFFDYCRANLVKYRRPVEVTFMDSLPRTNAKKLDKKALSALARRLA